ncbi:hypothetical protein [Klebsiella pneumoniae]|uniref:hypothetical protein n=1 Tax=Klebsiella pneumoniae TaxID=573 RepID=UPI00092F0182|nr:hypothetical protein [Klebsiella pneumoniae]
MNNEDYVSILVVVYNKTLEQSATINTLTKFSFYKRTRLTIYNNGPMEITIESKQKKLFNEIFYDSVLINDLNNKPLSLLYNGFIEDNKEANKVIILDDDTEITKCFIDAIFSSTADLELPRIISKETGRIYYPMLSGDISQVDAELDLNSKFCMSIASGLILDRKLLNEFYRRELKLFDERYALYGVDSSFFKRLKMLVRNGVCFNAKTSCYVRHSLSLTDKEFSEFRFKERLWDTAISTRCYPSIWQYYMFFYNFVKLFKYRKVEYFFILFRGVIRGKHPRCN